MRTMFRRERHRKIQTLLAAFDADLLTRFNILLGGGTRIALELDEYRDSTASCSSAPTRKVMRI